MVDYEDGESVAWEGCRSTCIKLAIYSFKSLDAKPVHHMTHHENPPSLLETNHVKSWPGELREAFTICELNNHLKPKDPQEN